MKLRIAKSLSVIFALGLGAAASAAGNGAAGGIYQKTAADGSVELSNMAEDTQAEPLVAALPAGTQTPDVASGTPAASDASPKAGQATPTQPEPIAWYGSVPPAQVKDTELAATLSKIGAAQLASGNPAAGRRYLMVDRNTYMKLYGSN